MAYKNIVLVGATGNLGPHALKALASAGRFNVTVLARHTSKSPIDAPSNVRVVKVDFGSHQALVDALRGQEALVLTWGDFGNLDKNTKVITEAAIEAGIKRIIPSDFGGDLQNPPGSTAPIFAPKVRTAEYLKEKAKEGKVTYTLVATGAFFDWGLTSGFMGFDLKAKKATLFDDGEGKFNATILASIGDAIVGILSNPEATANKAISIHDFFVSQNEILPILEKEFGEKFSVEYLNMKELAEKSAAGLAKGEVTEENIYGLVKALAFGSPSTARWGSQDESGLVGLSKKDLATEIKKVVQAFK